MFINNFITLSFVSFLVGSSSCIFIFIFRARDEAKERAMVVSHYSKIREIDDKYFEKEIAILKECNSAIMAFIKPFRFNYLTFLKTSEKIDDQIPDNKFSQFVRSFISISLTSLYFIILILLASFSIKYNSEVYLAFLESSILNYLITLVSMITSFNLTQRLLFSTHKT